MRSLKFHHTQLDTEIEVFTDTILGVLWLDKFQSTAIVGNGGATIPVIGTVEEVSKIVNAAKAAQPKQRKK